jgi:signal transduction histidine kinase
MLPEFIAEHGDELIARAREKVAQRVFPRSTPAELGYGVPLFLRQLAAILRDSSISEAAMMATAAKHGEEMLRAGFTVGQVVQDYGDVCECLTDLAVGLGSPIASEEFRTLNRCLDEAIGAAVTEFLRLREQSLSVGEMERFAALAHEQRNLLSAAMVAYQVLRSGHVRISGRTGAVLGRALMGLREITNRSLAAVRLSTGAQHRARIVLSEFIRDMEDTAALEATARGVHLTVGAVPCTIAVDADRLLLTSAVSNLLSNAFKFSRSKGHVSLRTVAAEGKIRIEVEDECGGLPAGLTEQLFRPFERRNADRTGLGLGLAISRQGVQANGGTLDVRNLPGKGCIFSINLPMTA